MTVLDNEVGKTVVVETPDSDGAATGDPEAEHAGKKSSRDSELFSRARPWPVPSRLGGSR